MSVVLATGQWVVLIDRSQSPEDTALIGMFASREDASAFIEEAHDPDDECMDPLGDSYGDANRIDGSEYVCAHMQLDDVEYARPAFVNVVAEVPMA